MPDDERIAEILGEWYERRDRGEEVTPEQVVASHPDLADPLRERFEMLGVIESLFEEPKELPEGTPREIGDFRLIREVGRGGMGVVYEAEQISMRRSVALKVLSLAITGTGQAVKRFEREAQAAGRLHHTNIVPVYAMGQFAGYWYYAMELVRGRALDRVVDELRALRGRPSEESLARLVGSTPEASPSSRAPESSAAQRITGTGERAYFMRLAEMFAGVADGLHVAHAEGIIHRDIKPSNLLLDEDGLVKIVDFGLARLEQDGHSMTITGDLLGTPAYMSPEQAMAKRVLIDHRTDIYSLGATLYEVLTLSPPFSGKNLPEICSQIIAKDPPLPRRTNRRIPRDLETIVMKTLEKDRDKRYQSARAFARDLRTFADGGSIRARRIGVGGRTWRKVKRHKVRSALAASVLLTAIVGAMFAQRASREAERRRHAEYDLMLGRGQGVMASSRSWIKMLPAPEATARQIFSKLTETPASNVKARDIFSDAIQLVPERPEAYWLRVLASGRTHAQRVEDLEAAGTRGLPRRTYHVTRAYLLEHERKWKEADEARNRARDEAETPAGDYFEAMMLESAGWFDKALKLLNRAVDGAARGSHIRHLALGRRASVRAEQDDLVGALQDLFALRAMGDETVAVRIRIASIWKRRNDEQTAQDQFEAILGEAREVGTRAAWRDLCAACRIRGAEAWHDRASQEALAAHPDAIGLMRERIAALQKRGDFEEANDLCRGALDLEPENHALRGDLATVLRRQEKHNEARSAYEYALKLDPQCVQCLFHLGVTLTFLDENELALVKFRKVVELHPRYATAYNSLGLTLRDLGKPKEAEKAYRIALRLASDAFVHSHLGILLVEDLNRPREARAQMEAAIRLAPKSATLHYNLGNIFLALRAYDDALDAYAQALKFQPGLEQAHNNRGHILFNRLNRLDDALKEFDKLIQIRETNGRAHFNRGMVLARLKDFPAARGAYARAIEIDAHLLDAYGNLGDLLYYKLHKPNEALAVLTRGIKVEPFAAGYVIRGSIRSDARHDYEGALDDYKSAIEIDKDNFDAHRNSGLALMSLRRHDKALKAFNRALGIDPKDARAHIDRGNTLRALKQVEEALDAFGRAIGFDPENIRAYISRGNLFHWLKRGEEALKDYRSAIELNMRSPHPHFMRATIFRPQGHYEKAFANYEEAINVAEAIHVAAKWPDAYGGALHTLCEWGQFDRALELSNRTLRQFTGNKLSSHYHFYFRHIRVFSLRAVGKTKEAQELALKYLPQEDPHHVSSSFIYLRAAAGQRKRAETLLQSYKSSSPEDTWTRACIRAVLNDKQAALESLKWAVEEGHRRPAAAAPDPDLEALLKDDPRYRKLMRRMHAAR